MLEKAVMVFQETSNPRFEREENDKKSQNPQDSWHSNWDRTGNIMNVLIALPETASSVQ